MFASNYGEVRSNFRQGQRLLRRGDYAAAATAFESCIRLDPANLPALYKLALAEEQLGRESAASRYQQLLTLTAEYKDAATRLQRLQRGTAGPAPAGSDRSVRPAERLSERERSGASGLRVFGSRKQILQALVIREFHLIYDKHRLRFLWLFLGPAMHVGVLWIAFELIKARHPYLGLSLPMFLVLGVIPWTLFRRVVRECMASISENGTLFGYRQIRPVDPVLATWLLQSITSMCVFGVFILLLWWAGEGITLVDPLGLFAALSLISVLALSTGLIAAVFAHSYTSTQRIVRPALRLLHFVSGVFFTIEMLPASVRPWASWNPILHAMDFIKAAFIPTYDSPADWVFAWSFAAVLLFLSLLFYASREREILQS